MQIQWKLLKSLMARISELKKACLTLSKNVKIKTKTFPTNLTCFDTRKVQQQN